jgi:hypothetical protein
MATFSQIFDNNTVYINSVDYTPATKKLEITFKDDLKPEGVAAAILQSLNNFLVSNTDLTINLSSSAPIRNSSSRNNEIKDQINISFQIYVPPAPVVFDPATI